MSRKLSRGQPFFRRYSKALLACVVQDATVSDKVYRDIKFLVDVLGKRDDFNLFISSFTVEKEKKEPALLKLLEELGMDQLVVGLARTLVRNNRIRHLFYVAKDFVVLYLEHINVVPVEVFLASEVDQDYAVQLQKTLKKHLQLDMLVTYTVAPSLLGGIMIKLHNKIMDATIANRLQKMAKVSKEAVSCLLN
jgi:F-type H+-transporting ATPase subunit delta